MRSFSEGGEARGSTPVPIFGALLSVDIPVSAALRVVPYTQLHYDARAVRFEVGSDVVSELSRLEGGGGVAIRFMSQND